MCLPHSVGPSVFEERSASRHGHPVLPLSLYHRKGGGIIRQIPSYPPLCRSSWGMTPGCRWRPGRSLPARTPSPRSTLWISTPWTRECGRYLKGTRPVLVWIIGWLQSLGSPIPCRSIPSNISSPSTAPSQHLPSYLEQRPPQWELLVAHFLGVDHAGHAHGSNSLEMVAKLQQVDEWMKEAAGGGGGVGRGEGGGGCLMTEVKL